MLIDIDRLLAVVLGCLLLTSATAQERSFIYVSPDPLGVNPFLLMGKTGIEQAAQQFDADVAVYESADPTTRADNVRAAVADGADIVVVLGFEFNDIIPVVAAQYPEVNFLIVDQCIDAPLANVWCAVFREYEATFLIGAMAAYLTQNNHVGVVSALDIPFLHRYSDGFALGARHVSAAITVDIRWVGGNNPFSDPARAKEQALAVFANGADYIFSATSGGDYGVCEAAQEHGFKVFSVDVNQCPSAPGHIVENTLKRVDVAILESIRNILAGSATHVLSYGLAEGGMNLVAFSDSVLADSGCLIAGYPEVIEKVGVLRQQIIAGELNIPDPMFQ
jgi:basic membrane protein A